MFKCSGWVTQSISIGCEFFYFEQNDWIVSQLSRDESNHSETSNLTPLKFTPGGVKNFAEGGKLASIYWLAYLPNDQIFAKDWFICPSPLNN